MDEKTFLNQIEKILELKQNTLKGNLPTDRLTDAEQRLNAVLKRQKTYKDFWE